MLARKRKKDKKRRKLPRSTYYSIFEQPFYYGYFEYPKGSGKVVLGKHNPMITKEMFDRVQEILGKNDTPKPTNGPKTYQGLMRCTECGAAIIAEAHEKHQKNGNVHKYTYYRCSHKINPDCPQKKYIEEKELNKQIAEYLEKIHIPKDFGNWLIEVLKFRNEKQFQAIKEHNQKIHDERNEISNKVNNLIDMKIDALIDEETFKRKNAELQDQAITLESRIKDENAMMFNWVNIANDIINFASVANKRFEKADLPKKRSALCSLGLNLYLKDKKLLPELFKPGGVPELPPVLSSIV